ncbi:hypothetical protein GOBAR_AA07905 [Gossypium barbadense]|uniref:Uncharacterized protein n=1 Tax=Gossypium barbadense TaxID=3634 RepID=A0A2P5YAX3_GOSBA|nr:hypothetical protein GOBAR_AA07905 [Gossypium barbadense]
MAYPKRFRTLGRSIGRLDCRDEIGLFPGHQIGLSKGWQIFAVGLEEDEAPFLFFEVGTAGFFPREDDMVTLQAKPLFCREECSR